MWVEMSELISGKEAKLAWANGEDIELCYKQHKEENTWFLLLNTDPLSTFDRDDFLFRLKPRTITINGIEVPAPFEPKEGERYWFMSTSTILGYACNDFELDKIDSRFMVNGAWKSEDEIKQVVAALRKIFVINNQ